MGTDKTIVDDYAILRQHEKQFQIETENVAWPRCAILKRPYSPPRFFPVIRPETLNFPDEPRDKRLLLEGVASFPVE
jgi:hypothetical protein